MLENTSEELAKELERLSALYEAAETSSEKARLHEEAVKAVQDAGAYVSADTIDELAPIFAAALSRIAYTLCSLFADRTRPMGGLQELADLTDPDFAERAARAALLAVLESSSVPVSMPIPDTLEGLDDNNPPQA